MPSAALPHWVVVMSIPRYVSRLHYLIFVDDYVMHSCDIRFLALKHEVTVNHEVTIKHEMTVKHEVTVKQDVTIKHEVTVNTK